ncbi:MAG: RNA degradosome polyphosphate kinase, partial [Acidobacteria bacterium]|nr:RNA degradosome polyphosphate kinase [Acidobacteriota bacterium]
MARGLGIKIVRGKKNRGKLFLNRELSWLAFNARVVEESANDAHPLLERLRFLAISAGNLDEFYMVRVAGLRGQVAAGVGAASQDGLTPARALGEIKRVAGAQMQRQQRCFRLLMARLRQAGVALVAGGELSRNERRWLDGTFRDEVLPVLTPLALDPAQPFPFLPNGGIAMVLRLRRQAGGESLRALLPLPMRVPRFVRLPGQAIRWLALEDMLGLNLDTVFPGLEVEARGLFRILRDSEMEIEGEAEDLVRTFEAALERRRRGQVIRLTCDADMPPDLLQLVTEGLSVDPGEVFPQPGRLGLADAAQMIVDERPDLRFAPHEARVPERIREFGGDCFEAIRHKDIIVHHPYESFDVVLEFLRQAARDPAVVAIKQTLYRTSEDSPIMAALIEAAQAGKSVTAVVELKARFDEARTLRWGRHLERAGVQVVYGFIGLKTHAKMTLVTRREGGRLRAYAHFGTGNYHPVTARTYADLSLFTCEASLCRDAALTFNYTTGTARPAGLEKLAVAPHNLRQRLMRLIEAEIASAGAGGPAKIWAKLNALACPDMIDALYRASRAGVSIDLVVRGICCLRPGVPGLSDNIRVKSIVGRFLEHARIVCFGNGHNLPSRHAKVF